MTTRSQTNSLCLVVRTDGTIPWPSKLSAHCSSTNLSILPDEPSSFTEANKFPKWRKAMNDEFQALLATNTWDLVPPSASKNVLGVKWVFKTKRFADGSIEHRKARLVAKGYHQLEGLDFNKTFSPVVKPSTIRMLLSLVVMLN